MTSFTITNYAGDHGKVLLPLPKDKASNYFEIGDEIEFKKHDKPGFEIVNLSCKVLRLSRFKRDLISNLRRLDNDEHPLKRCILLGDVDCVFLSIKKNPEKINAINTQQK